ncbi:SRPBCC domain-containing protein, partial [Microbacterium gubbeenense]
IPAQLQLLSDTRVRISRVIRGSVSDVWRAHHDADLLAKWQLGPDGWEMTEVTPPAGPGSAFRYRWAPLADTEGEAFSIGGEVQESHPESRIVHTERMEGFPGETLNEVTLTPVPEGTLLSYVITYASAEERDMILATGMVDGMEASYARLERILA